MPYIQIWQSSTGKIRLTGSQKPKGNMAKGVPLTPPESNSNVSSPKASDHDGQAANQDRCDVMIDMLLAASRWTKATDHRVNLLVAACEMIDMPTQDITSLADACLDEARMPLNRGREEFVENADVDGKATKKVRIEEREDSQSSGEGSQNPRQKPVGDRAVWSDLESEAAFIAGERASSLRFQAYHVAAQVSIPPIDPRSKITAFGRHLGRNQLIAIVVSLATGRLHDRKAISSHGQTLRAKNNKKGYPEHRESAPVYENQLTSCQYSKYWAGRSPRFPRKNFKNGRFPEISRTSLVCRDTSRAWARTGRSPASDTPMKPKVSTRWFLPESTRRKQRSMRSDLERETLLEVTVSHFDFVLSFFPSCCLVYISCIDRNALLCCC